MYYIILGILEIIFTAIDMWINLKVDKLMWKRKTTFDKGLKIVSWILAIPISIMLFAMAAPENPFSLGQVDELSAYVDVIQ